MSNPVDLTSPRKKKAALKLVIIPFHKFSPSPAPPRGFAPKTPHEVIHNIYPRHRHCILTAAARR